MTSNFSARALSDAFRIMALGLTLPDEEAAALVSEGELAKEMACVLDSLGASGTCAAWEGCDLSSLRREYTRLFSAPGGGAVPIWESAFADPLGEACEFGPMLARTAQAADAKRRYEAVGLRMAANESADHMRIECEFACYLLAMSCEAEDPEEIDSWLKLYEEFSESHLCKWFGPFCERTAAEARHPFYRTLAEFGLLFTSAV